MLEMASFSMDEDLQPWPPLFDSLLFHINPRIPRSLLKFLYRTTIRTYGWTAIISAVEIQHKESRGRGIGGITAISTALRREWVYFTTLPLRLVVD